MEDWQGRKRSRMICLYLGGVVMLPVMCRHLTVVVYLD